MQSIPTDRKKIQSPLQTTTPVRPTFLKFVYKFENLWNVENRTGRGWPSVFEEMVQTVIS